MRAEDVLELYTLLLAHGVQIWIDGGWGIDALLERETRPHKGLDAFVAFDDLPTLTAVLSRRGFVLKEIWGENRWLRHAGHVLLIGTGETGGEVATAFVLKDALGREMDVHTLQARFTARAYNSSHGDAVTQPRVAGSSTHVIRSWRQVSLRVEHAK